MLLNQAANKITFSTALLICKSLTLLFGVLLNILSYPSFANSFLKELRSPQYLPLEAQWCLRKGDCLFLEVADTSKERRIGLMDRPSLSQGTGMWFKFLPAQRVGFWMKKMLFPIDMVFISKGFIVALETNLQACASIPCIEYGPNVLVDGVIELAAGEAERLGMKVGDLVNIKYKSIE